MTDIRVSFGIMGADLKPVEISGLLDLEPDHSHEQGSRRTGKSGRRYSDFSEGLWEMRSRLPPSNSLTEHLSGLIAVLGTRGETLRQLRRKGYALDVFVGVFDETGNVTVKVDHALLKALEALGVDLVLDVYAASSPL